MFCIYVRMYMRICGGWGHLQWCLVVGASVVGCGMLMSVWVWPAIPNFPRREAGSSGTN